MHRPMSRDGNPRQRPNCGVTPLLRFHLNSHIYGAGHLEDWPGDDDGVCHMAGNGWERVGEYKNINVS